MFDIKTGTDDYLSIVVTHECNRSCPFCIDQYRGQNEYISLEAVAAALIVAKEREIKDILLVGGEPTLHPQIVKIAKLCRSAGFRVIITTNYTRPDIVQKLDGIVNSFNISWYGQKSLPEQEDFDSDLTLSALIFKGQLDTKQKLDDFIAKHQGLALKFSTLSPCNAFCKAHQEVGYLDTLPGERVVLFDEIEGILYENVIIKRYDRIVNPSAQQSLKCHVNGAITRNWERKN